MTEHGTPRPEDAAASGATPPAVPDALKGKSQGRRRLLTSGLIVAPAILTLSSRPVLAKKKKCSISATLSNNPSISTSTNCGVSPGCWKNLAASDGKWQSTAFSPTQSFTTVSQLNALTILNRPSPPNFGWMLFGSDLSLLNGGFNGGCSAVYVRHDHTYTTITGLGFLSQCVAALLNASFFNSFSPPRYPLTVAGVANYINANLNKPGTTNSNGTPSAELTLTQAQSNASVVNNYFNSLITDGYPCGVVM